MPLYHLTVPAALLTAALCGCTSTRSYSRAHVEWADDDRSLGRVVLLQELIDVEPADRVDQKQAQVAEIANRVLVSLPDTELLDTAGLAETLGSNHDWTGASDYELVNAAREIDVDTICLLRVHEFTGYLDVGFLPLPGWATRTVVGYEMRVLDVPSGRLRLDARRGKSKGGWLSIQSVDNIATQFEQDLDELFALNDQEPSE